MTAEELRFLSADEADQLPSLLHALWHDAQGNWTAAHEVAQEIDTADGASVHAYLHRREGDRANAAYWYRRAGTPVFSGELESEWKQLVDLLLHR